MLSLSSIHLPLLQSSLPFGAGISENKNSDSWKAFTLSVVLHLLLLFVVTTEIQSKVFAPVEVTLIDPAKQTDQPLRVVSPSESPESKIIPLTHQLSDRTTKVDKQQIRRGLPEPAGVPNQVQTETKKTNSTEQEQKREKPTTKHSSQLEQLRLNDEQLLETLEQQKQQKPANEEREKRFQEARPFSRVPAGRSLVQSGSPDFLPEIPDGDITLLNAKADRFAVFVRRVALQVFGSLRKESWANMSVYEVRAAGGFVTVEAIMSPTGKLLSAVIQESSGSRLFDQAVLSAARSGTWDQNPPSAALAPDGNIRFIFRSRVWSRPSAGSMQEQRWLLLGTGLR